MVLYADDVLIYRGIHFHHDYNSWQNDVNQIFNWSTANCKAFNPSNCKQMVIIQETDHPLLQLGSNFLERVLCIQVYRYARAQRINKS